MPDAYQPGFVLLHILSSLLLFSIAKFHDLHGLNRKSFSALFKTTAFTFATLAFITFFLRDYAFSRWILLLGFVSTTLFLSALRMMIPGYRSNLTRTRMLIVGVGPQTSDLVRLIRSKVDWNADIVGIIIQKESPWTDTFEGIPIIGRPEHAPDLIRFHKIDQVLFSGNAIQTGDMLSVMSQIRNPLVSVKLVPESMDFVIGKSNVDYLDDIALVDVDIPYTRAWNRFLKRNLDVVVSAIALLITGVPGLFVWLLAVLSGKKRSEIRLYAEDHHATVIRLFQPHSSHVWLNRFMLMGYVFLGKLSLVGAPLHPDRHPLPVYYKPGLTGLRQLNEDRLKTKVEKEHYERHYVQNHSIWLDIGLLFKSVIAGRFYDGRL
jgi:FlaA1/EpsC-like NDP-sugar epimerase